MAALRIDTEHPALLRCGEKGFGQFEAELVRGDLVAEVGPLRRRLAILTDDRPLQIRTVLADADVDRAALLVVEQLDGVDFSGVDAFKVDADELLQATGPRDRMRDTVLATEIEVVQPVGAVLVTGGDLVEFILHSGGEVVIDQAAEVLLKQAGHRKSHPRGDQCAALLVDVTPVLDGLDDRGIR